MVITDLDGTLLRDDKKVSAKDLATLHRLGKKGMVRVAATGRPIQLVYDVLPRDFPIDYAVFSSGAGVADWKTGEIMRSLQFARPQVAPIIKLLKTHGLSFAVQRAIPENHTYYYHKGRILTRDFRDRVMRSEGLARPLPANGYTEKFASQLLVTFEDIRDFDSIRNSLEAVQVIRATSPVDFRTIWMEIFPLEVSKGQACAWLCRQLGIPGASTLAVGNDFNDLHMLEWAAHSYVVSNAPAELQARFSTVDSNQASGFSKAVNLKLDAQL